MRETYSYTPKKSYFSTLMSTEKQQLRIAILDLYACTSNQGMRGIRQTIQEFEEKNQLECKVSEFEVRLAHKVPTLDFDIYISSGGPGSPLESENSEWEKLYFNWLQQVINYNNDGNNPVKKHVFFICHSFQLACRFFNAGKVINRKSQAFGVFPVHFLPAAHDEIIFKGLSDPFYAVDSRDYQVIQPNLYHLNEIGATILAIEKARPHVPYERALMAIRFNEFMFGTQFHPEADAIGMIDYLHTDEKKKTVIENHSEQKWKSMIEQLHDPEKIMNTYACILPNFLTAAIKNKITLPIY